MTRTSLLAWLAAQWFLCGLSGALLAGWWWQTELGPLANSKTWQHLVIAGVMYLMAVPIEFSVVRRVLGKPLAPLVASLINVGLAPLLMWPLVGPLGPELGTGFAVVAATPCTLASAAVWTRRAGGNEVVAILVTLLTNLTSCWVLPAWLAVLTARSTSGEGLGAISWLLFWIVVVPIIAAQCSRRIPACERWVTRWRQALGVVCQLGLLSIVLVGSVKMAERLGTAEGEVLSLPRLVLCGGLALGLHLTLFAIGWRTAAWLRLPRGEQLAVGFAGSQKTLMIALSVAIELGFSIVPLVLYHLLQLIADTLLADRFRQAEERPPRVPPGAD